MFIILPVACVASPLSYLFPYLHVFLLLCNIAHALEHLLCLIVLRTVLPPPKPHLPRQGISGAGSCKHTYRFKPPGNTQAVLATEQ